MAPKFSERPKLTIKYIGSYGTGLWPTSASGTGFIAELAIHHAGFPSFTHQTYPSLEGKGG